MGMAIYGFKGKIKKIFLPLRWRTKSGHVRQSVIRKSDCDTLFFFHWRRIES
ncbi:hypothetical protein [Klebsiella pneumoniae IS53]|nr:hypothetical protein [Klebsiella pneumoniae IS53]